MKRCFIIPLTYVVLLHYVAKHQNIKITAFHLNAVLLLCETLTICCLITSTF